MRTQIIILFMLVLGSLTQVKGKNKSKRTVWNSLLEAKDSLALNIRKAESYRNSNLDSCLKYLNLSKETAHRLNDYRLQAKVLSDLILIYRKEGRTGKISETGKEIISVNKHLLSSARGKEQISLLLSIADGYADANTDSAFYYYNKVISLSKNYADEGTEANAYLNTGYLYAHIEDHSNAFDRYREALELFKKIDDKKGIAEALQAIGKLFKFFGNYNQALKLEKESAEKYKEINDYEGYYKSMRHIGEIYLSMGKLKKSLEVLTAAVESAKKNNYTLILSSLYQGLGKYYSGTKDYEKAIACFKKGLNLRTINKEPAINLINNYNSLGNAYRKKGDYYSSLNCYYKALKILKKIDNLIALSTTQRNIAQSYAETGNIVKSINYLEKSIKNAETIGNRYSILASYAVLINNYEKINNYKYALIYLKKYSVLEDSLELNSNRNKIEQFKNIYQKEKSANVIENLESDERKIILTAKIGITLLSLIVLLVLFSRYKIKSDSNKRLLERNKKIADMLAEVSGLNKSLKKSEDTYRNLFERNPLPLLILHKNTGQITAVNRAAVNHYGYSKKEFLALTIDGLHNQEQTHFSEECIKYYASKTERIANIKHQKRNGDYIDVEVMSHPFLFEGKDAYSIIIQDVTERKRAERAVMESEERYRILFEGSPDAVILIDRALKIIKDANPAAAVLFRKNWTDLVGTDYLSLFSESSREKIMQYFAGMNIEPNSEIIEAEIALTGGLKLTVEISGRLVNLPHFSVYQINIRDITQRKEAEKELRQSEKRLLKTQKIAHVGNWEIDLSSKNIWISGEACIIMGIDEDHNYISTEQVLDFIIEEDRQVYETAMRNLIRENKDFNLTIKIHRFGNNEVRIIHLKAEAIRDKNGEALKILGAIRDITELKKYQDELIRAKEEAEFSNKRKSDFLAQMSHEIRSPVNTILSFSSLIGDELDNKAGDDIKACFNAIDSGGRRLIRTIDLVLNIADIQTGEYDLKLERIDLAKDIIENLMLEFHTAASGKNLQLGFVNELNGRKIWADRYTITQIFANLIDNSIKYTRSGSITIKLTGDDNSINISIEDTGTGISKEYLPHLFDPFSQEKQNLSGKYKGSGLGLSLVKKYCDLNHAEIKVESQKDKGSKFTVSFKIDKPDLN